MSILIGVGIYFALGGIALGVLDLVTQRIRGRLSDASQEARSRLIMSGSFVGVKEAVVLTIGALWLFWPLAIFSALRGGNDGEEK